MCFHLYYRHVCISLYTCANVICIKLLLTYLLTYITGIGNVNFFCSCDLDLDPMTFIYEPDPYSLEIHRMCNCNLQIWTSYGKAFKSYRPTDRQTDRQTRPKLYTTPLRRWSKTAVYTNVNSDTVSYTSKTAKIIKRYYVAVSMCINCSFYILYTQWTIKKRDTLFLAITLANLNRFLQFLYHFNREEILHPAVVKFTTSP